MKRSRIQTSYPAPRDWLGTDAKVVRHVRVCGDGHLAVATRIELRRLGIQRDSDYLLPSLRPDLVIACGDNEDDQSFAEVAQRAIEQGSALLLGCLHGRLLRLGPLINPEDDFLRVEPPFGPTPCPIAEPDVQPPESHMTALPHVPAPTPSAPMAGTPTASATALGGHAADPDQPLTLYARLGALLISTQALSFLLGDRTSCILDRAVEFNPWSMESKSYGVRKVRQ
jgi:hypothetical protein